MAKNVMKLLKPSPSLGKNGFDLSHRKLFDANMGELLPCCCVETVPDDNIEIRVADLLRAMPMVTSPFMRVKQHIDFWFVPYNNLWHGFNQFITSRQEPQSSVENYSSFCPHFNLRQLKQQIFGAGTSVTDVFGDHDSYKRNAYRLLDLLGYPTYNLFYFDDPDPSAQPMTIYDDIDVNPWRLLAYQNIWYHEYRQKYYDNGSLGLNMTAPNSVACVWNVDFCRGNSFANADIIQESSNTGFFSNGWAASACQMRYRPWKKDLYTGLMPSTQLGAVSQVSNNVNGFGFIFTPQTGQSFAANQTITSGGSSSNPTVNLKDAQGTTLGNYSVRAQQMSILALRSANALQIWRENALRAGNQIEDNFEAHYGVKPKSHLNQHPIAIGSIDSPLNISDVTATADTGGSQNGSVGDIAGKGISSLDGDKVLRFKTNDFGIVMGIFSLLPETEYNSTGVDRPNQLLEQFDYFSPEMENLGLEAVDSGTFTLTVQHQVSGYAPRYYGYKTIPDKAHLSFINDPNNSLSGIYRAWASPKFDIQPNSQGLIPLGQLYVRPATFDVNFNVNTALSSQFLVDLYNNVSAVRPLSVTGMPSK